jgi:hypothetical protein
VSSRFSISAAATCAALMDVGVAWLFGKLGEVVEKPIDGGLSVNRLLAMKPGSRHHCFHSATGWTRDQKSLNSTLSKNACALTTLPSRMSRNQV